jgi:hypothetical protein
VLDIINDIADLQEAILLLNLAWFLAYQIEFKRLMIAAVIVTLLWGDQFKSHNFHMSSIQVNWIVMFKQPASQDQSLIAKGHSKKMWKEDSIWLLQRLHIDGRKQSLIIRFSSVGIFWCINLHTIRDFEGGIAWFQINLAQGRSWNCCNLKEYACLSSTSPESVCFHKSLSWESSIGMVTLLIIELKLLNIKQSWGGIVHWPLRMKSLTVEDNKGPSCTGMFSCSIKGLPHQLSVQKFMFVPLPSSQTELFIITLNSSFTLLQREEKTWCRMTLLYYPKR